MEFRFFTINLASIKQTSKGLSCDAFFVRNGETTEDLLGFFMHSGLFWCDVQNNHNLTMSQQD